MSIKSAVRKAGPYTGNGATVDFPFAFKVFSASDLLVIRTDLSEAESELTLGTDYTVALNADQDANPGGTITALVAPATGYLLTITSAVQNLQPVGLTNKGGFYPKVLNDALDRATIQIQQVAEQVGRSVKVSISSSLTPDQMIESITVSASSASDSAEAAASSEKNASIKSEEASEAAKSAIAAASSVAGFQPGTRLAFAQATAPTGWTQDVSDSADNRMLRVVKTEGGGVGGNTDHSPILMNVVPAHTHSFTSGTESADHSHTGTSGTESADHSHVEYVLSSTGTGLAAAGTGMSTTRATNCSTGGRSATHTHTTTTGGASVNHTHSGSTDNGSSQVNWAPRYIDLIICSKD